MVHLLHRYILRIVKFLSSIVSHVVVIMKVCLSLERFTRRPISAEWQIVAFPGRRLNLTCVVSYDNLAAHFQQSSYDEGVGHRGLPATCIAWSRKLFFIITFSITRYTMHAYMPATRFFLLYSSPPLSRGLVRARGDLQEVEVVHVLLYH